MSELEKSETPGVTDAVDTGESPLSGTTQSVGDATQPVDYEALAEQAMLADGVEMPEPAGEDAAETAPQPIANEVVEDQSFWSGFFGKPNIPTVE